MGKWRLQVTKKTYQELLDKLKHVNLIGKTKVINSIGENVLDISDVEIEYSPYSKYSTLFEKHLHEKGFSDTQIECVKNIVNDICLRCFNYPKGCVCGRDD